MSDDSTDMDRRKLLGSAAVIGGAVPLLAACGSDEPASEEPGSQDGDGGNGDGAKGGNGDGGSGQQGQALQASEVPVGGGTILKDQKIVVTQPEKDEFKAFSAVCTHNQCVVSEVSEKAIICHCHESHYDLSTGDVLSGPAPEPLPEKTVQQDNGTLTIS